MEQSEIGDFLKARMQDVPLEAFIDLILVLSHSGYEASSKVESGAANRGEPDMPGKKYLVKLETDERNQLLDMTSKGAIGARKMKRAQIVLKVDEGWKDEAIIQALNTSRLAPAAAATTSSSGACSPSTRRTRSLASASRARIWRCCRTAGRGESGSRSPITTPNWRCRSTRHCRKKCSIWHGSRWAARPVMNTGWRCSLRVRSPRPIMP